MVQNVIVLSDDGSESDDDVAFVGSRRVDPGSPVFVRASASTAIEVIEVTDDESDVCRVANVSSDAPDFDTFFGLREREHEKERTREGSAGPSRCQSPRSNRSVTPEILFPSSSPGPAPASGPSTVRGGPVRLSAARNFPSSSTTIGGSHMTSNTLRPAASESDMDVIARPKRSLQEILNDPYIFSSATAEEPSASPPDVQASSPKNKKTRKTAAEKTQTNTEKTRTSNPENADPDSDDGLTSEQRAKERERARRKADKEAEKAAARAARQLARDTAKAAKEAEKSYQKKIADVNRLRTTRNDALRDIEIHMAYDLSLPSAPIAGALPELKQRIQDSNSSLHFLSEEDTIVPGSIQFRRHVRADWNPVLKRYVPLEHERLEWETTTVLVASAEDIVDRVAQGDDALIDWFSDVRLTLRVPLSEQLILVVRGMEKYHSKTQSIIQRNFRETARAGLAGQDVVSMSSSSVTNRVDRGRVETGLLRAQVMQRVFVVHVDKTEDIEEWVFNLAGDVALRPYKLLSKSHLPFSAPEGMRKVNRPGEAIELMLQEVQGVTSSAAAGIAVEHGSFRELMQAYEAAERRGGDRAEHMLADCDIRTRQNGQACSRKVGKALSKRVYNLMRGEDPLALM